MKTDQPQNGEWRMLYNIIEDWYCISESEGIMKTAIKNTIEHLHTEQDCLDRVVELGVTLDENE